MATKPNSWRAILSKEPGTALPRLPLNALTSPRPAEPGLHLRDNFWVLWPLPWSWASAPPHSPYFSQGLNSPVFSQALCLPCHKHVFPGLCRLLVSRGMFCPTVTASSSARVPWALLCLVLCTSELCTQTACRMLAESVDFLAVHFPHPGRAACPPRAACPSTISLCFSPEGWPGTRPLFLCGFKSPWPPYGPARCPSAPSRPVPHCPQLCHMLALGWRVGSGQQDPEGRRPVPALCWGRGGGAS